MYFSSTFRIYELFATCLFQLRHLLPVSFRVVGVVLVRRETKGYNSIYIVVQSATGSTGAVLLPPLLSFPVCDHETLVPQRLPEVKCVIRQQIRAENLKSRRRQRWCGKCYYLYKPFVVVTLGCLAPWKVNPRSLARLLPMVGRVLVLCIQGGQPELATTTTFMYKVLLILQDLCYC